jgi:hypothetical protein
MLNCWELLVYGDTSVAKTQKAGVRKQLMKFVLHNKGVSK